MMVLGLVLASAPFARGQCPLGRVDAPSPDAFERNGTAVAADGDVVVSGAPSNDDFGADIGAVHVHRRAGAGWNYEGQLFPTGAGTFELFGSAVDVDGDVIVVGAYAGVSIPAPNGAAYVFRYDGSQWVQEQRLVSPDPYLEDFFGWSVAVSGDRLVIGDPSNNVFGTTPGRAFVYDFDGTSWVLTAELVPAATEAADYFAWSVDIEGDRIVAGTPYRDRNGVVDSGSASIFTFNGSSWIESTLTPSAPGNPYDLYGYDVAFNGPDQVVIGAPQLQEGSGPTGDGFAEIFVNGFGAWLSLDTIEDVTGTPGALFGRCVAGSDSTIIVGSPGRRAVQVFALDGTYAFERFSTSVTSDAYGRSVAASGNVVFIGAPEDDLGAPNSGGVHVAFRETTNLPFVRGDANSDGSLNIADAIWMLSYVFADGIPPACGRAGDANADDRLDVGDPIYLINYTFADGPDPSAPFPSCGTVPPGGSICCLSSPSCP